MSHSVADSQTTRTQAARDLVMALTKAMRNVSFYDREHPAVMRSLTAAGTVADAIVATDREFTIKFVDGEIVVDDRPLFDATSSTGNLVGACRRRGIDTLTLRQGLRAEELAHVVSLLTMDPSEIELLGGPAAVLERQGIRHITAERLREIAEGQTERAGQIQGLDLLLRPREMYVESLDVVRGAMAQARRGVPLDLEPTDQTDAPAVAALVAFEHHMQANLSGYPKVRRARDLNMYSLMASIADVYDALTTERPYRPPLPPERALRIMHDMPVGSFELRLLSTFSEILGKHPPGTMMRLDSGDLAVVSRPNPNDPERPFVRILRQVDGGHALDPAEVDLSQRDEKTQAHLLAVTEILNPQAEDIDVEELLRDLPQTESY